MSCHLSACECQRPKTVLARSIGQARDVERARTTDDHCWLAGNSEALECLLGAQGYWIRLGWPCDQRLMQLLVSHHCTVLHCHAYFWGGAALQQAAELECSWYIHEAADGPADGPAAGVPAERREAGSPQRLGGAEGSRRSGGGAGRARQRQRLLAVGQPPLHQHAVEHLARRRRPAAAAAACMGAYTDVMRCASRPTQLMAVTPVWACAATPVR